MKSVDVEEEEEADNEICDQCKEKVRSMSKPNLKTNNVKTERAHRIHRRKRSHNKDKPCTIVFKLHSYEGKESTIWNVWYASWKILVITKTKTLI